MSLYKIEEAADQGHSQAIAFLIKYGLFPRKWESWKQPLGSDELQSVLDDSSGEHKDADVASYIATVASFNAAVLKKAPVLRLSATASADRRTFDETEVAKSKKASRTGLMDSEPADLDEDDNENDDEDATDVSVGTCSQTHDTVKDGDWGDDSQLRIQPRFTSPSFPPSVEGIEHASEVDTAVTRTGSGRKRGAAEEDGVPAKASKVKFEVVDLTDPETGGDGKDAEVKAESTELENYETPPETKVKLEAASRADEKTVNSGTCLT